MFSGNGKFLDQEVQIVEVGRIGSLERWAVLEVSGPGNGNTGKSNIT